MGGNPPSQRGYSGQALLEHWNGSIWSIVAAPPSTVTWFAGSRFELVRVASSNVWAIGDFDSLYWDGAVWSVVQGAQSTSAAPGPHREQGWRTVSDPCNWRSR